MAWSKESKGSSTDAAAVPDPRASLPSQMRSEFFESIYDTDNNRGLATSPCDETSGTRCRRTTLRSRSYGRHQNIRAPWSQTQSSVMPMCSDHPALRPPVGTGVRVVRRESTSTLKETARAKLRHRARKPAFRPRKGSWLLKINKAAQPTPATSPEKTPAIVTRFQKMPRTTPGRNCVTPAYPSRSNETNDNEL